MLVGHEAQVAQFLDALGSGRLHHAWLLAGPKGVGKRAFADAAALRLLAGEGDGLSVSPDHPTAHLIEAGSHMDHRILMREVDDKGKQAAEIKVDQVRSLQPLFRSTPVLGDWRTVIVDSVDEMNVSAANAFLKNLEEPPKQTLFFLVSHAPGRLLPTIRSRCMTLRFGGLGDAEMRAVLQRVMPEAGDMQALVAVADGSPGEALRYAGLDLKGLGTAIDGVMRGDDLAAFARGFQAIGAAARFEALMALGPRRIADAARVAPSAAMVGLYAQANALCSGAVKLAYDRVQVAFQLATLLAEAGRLSGK